MRKTKQAVQPLHLAVFSHAIKKPGMKSPDCPTSPYVLNVPACSRQVLDCWQIKPSIHRLYKAYNKTIGKEIGKFLILRFEKD
jgi:hypothetical protein